MRKYASAEVALLKRRTAVLRTTTRAMLLLLWKRHHKNAVVGMSLTVCHSSGSSPLLVSTMYESQVYTHVLRIFLQCDA